MTAKSPKFKSIALCLRGFELEPQLVESIAGLAASESGKRGEPVKPGVKTLLQRSYVRYSIDFSHGCRLDEMVPALWLKMGGLAHLSNLRDQVLPEFFEVDIILPIKKSTEQEGGFLLPETLHQLNLLCASLSFQFI